MTSTFWPVLPLCSTLSFGYSAENCCACLLRSRASADLQDCYLNTSRATIRSWTVGFQVPPSSAITSALLRLHPTPLRLLSLRPTFPHRRHPARSAATSAVLEAQPRHLQVVTRTTPAVLTLGKEGESRSLRHQLVASPAPPLSWMRCCSHSKQPLPTRLTSRHRTGRNWAPPSPSP